MGRVVCEWAENNLLSVFVCIRAAERSDSNTVRERQSHVAAKPSYIYRHLWIFECSRGNATFYKMISMYSAPEYLVSVDTVFVIQLQPLSDPLWLHVVHPRWGFPNRVSLRL